MYHNVIAYLSVIAICFRRLRLIHLNRILVPITLFCLISSARVLASPPLVPYPVVLDAGTAAEQAAVIQNQGSSIVNGARMADAGQAWVYGFAVNPGEICLLTLIVDGNAEGPLPQIVVAGQDNKPLPARITRGEDGSIVVTWVVPDMWPIGGRIAIVFAAKPDPLR